MAERIPMIALSPTMEEGKILSWKVKPGDQVKSGMVLCEVETDKATMEYESPREGTLLKLIRQEGESVKVGEPIAWIGKPGEQVPDEPSPSRTAGLADTGQKGEMVESTRPAERGALAEGAVLAERGKGTTTSEASRRIEEGRGAATAGAGETGRKAPEGSSSAEEKSTFPLASMLSSPYGGSVKSSPLARKLSSELGIDIRRIPGSGPGGRVIKRDVLRFREAAGKMELQPETAFPIASAAAASSEQPPVDREIPVSGMRATIAKRLSESFFTAPHYFLRVAVQMDALMDARSRYNAESPQKLSLNAFFIKLAAEALRRHPQINSTWKGTSIQIHGSIDIGLAVALPDGLITPVVRNCGGKGIREIDQELTALIEKAKKGGLKPEEYTNATFTISNLGAYGIEEFTAIINPPGSAILALGEIRKEPIATEADEIVIRRILRMTLSCDHRTIDGAVGAVFLRDLKGMMEDPFRIIL